MACVNHWPKLSLQTLKELSRDFGCGHTETHNKGQLFIEVVETGDSNFKLGTVEQTLLIPVPEMAFSCSSSSFYQVLVDFPFVIQVTETQVRYKIRVA